MDKRGHLVCQYLEGISREALNKYQSIIRQYVRRRHGIYALYRNSRLYYVGLASDLRFRLKQHLRDRHGASWDRFSVYLTVREEPLRELESLIVRISKPAGNSQAGTFYKAIDLRRTFKRNIKALQRKELEAIIGQSELAEPIKSLEGRQPVLAKFKSRPSVLRAKFKGKVAAARIRHDGSIRFNGKVYGSPSLAAAAACRRPTCNGWTFWSYERAPGDWVKLDELRK